MYVSESIHTFDPPVNEAAWHKVSWSSRSQDMLFSLDGADNVTMSANPGAVHTGMNDVLDMFVGARPFALGNGSRFMCFYTCMFIDPQ